VLFPRLALKLDNGDDLNLSAGAQAGRSHWEGQSNTHDLVGTFPAPDWIESHGRTPANQLMLRSEVNWIAKMAGGKLDLTVSAERSRNSNDSDNDLYTDNRALHLERNWDTTTRATRYAFRTKFTRSGRGQFARFRI
jgi:hypothetical protein